MFPFKVALVHLFPLESKIIYINMKQEDNKSKLSRKPLHGKHINGKLFRLKQTHSSFSPNKQH